MELSDTFACMKRSVYWSEFDTHATVRRAPNIGRSKRSLTSYTGTSCDEPIVLITAQSKEPRLLKYKLMIFTISRSNHIGDHAVHMPSK